MPIGNKHVIRTGHKFEMKMANLSACVCIGFVCVWIHICGSFSLWRSQINCACCDKRQIIRNDLCRFIPLGHLKIRKLAPEHISTESLCDRRWTIR